jgi:hypothetical protein
VLRVLELLTFSTNALGIVASGTLISIAQLQDLYSY